MDGGKRDKRKRAATKPNTSPKSAGTPAGRKKKAAAQPPGPLRSVRLTDAAFAGRLLGKYGWAVGATKRRAAIVHRDGATGAMRPPSRSMHVDLHIRNVRPLLQLYTRVFATVQPPKPVAGDARRGPRSASAGAAGAAAGGRDAAGAPAGAAPAQAKAAASAAGAQAGTAAAPSSASAVGASPQTELDVLRMWETFREATSTLRRIETLQRAAPSRPGRLLPVVARRLAGDARAAMGGAGAAGEPSGGSAAPTETQAQAGAAAIVRDGGIVRRTAVTTALQRLVHAKTQGGAAMRLRLSPFAAPGTSGGAADTGQGAAKAPIAAARRTPPATLQRSAASAEAAARPQARTDAAAGAPAPADVGAPTVVTSAARPPLRPVYRVERKETRNETFRTRSFDRSSLQEVVRHMTRLVSHSTASERTIAVVRKLIERETSRLSGLEASAHRPQGPNGASGRTLSPREPKTASTPAEGSGLGTSRPVGSTGTGDGAGANVNVARTPSTAPSMVPLRPGRLAAPGVQARSAGARSPEAVAARVAPPSAPPGASAQAVAAARVAAVAPLQRRVAAGKPLARPIPIVFPSSGSTMASGSRRIGSPTPVPLVTRLLTVIERRGWTPAKRDRQGDRDAVGADRGNVAKPPEQFASGRATSSAKRAEEPAVRSNGTPPAPVGMVQRRPIVLVRGGATPPPRSSTERDGEGTIRSAQRSRTSAPVWATRGPLVVRTAPKAAPPAPSSNRPGFAPSSGAPRSASASAGVGAGAGRFADRITQRFQDRYTERLTVRFAERAARLVGRSAPAIVAGTAGARRDGGAGNAASAPPPLQTARATWIRREPGPADLAPRRRIVDAATPGTPDRLDVWVTNAAQPIAPGRAAVARIASASAASRFALQHRAARRATLTGGTFRTPAVGSRTSPMQRATRPPEGRNAASASPSPAPASQTHRVAARLVPSARQAPTTAAASAVAQAPQTHRVVARLVPAARPAPSTAISAVVPAPQTHRVAARIVPAARPAPSTSAPSSVPASAASPAPAQRAAVRGAALVHRAGFPAAAAPRRGIATARAGATIGHAVTESTVAPAKRYVGDIRLDVAAKSAARERPSQDPVVQTLKNAVKTVEAELQKAKELWEKPKLDMNRLSDQLYKELSKRIRFESQRRGL